MAKNIQAIRGMNDYLPGETAIWQRIEGTLKNVLGSYGYSEIRLPIVEQTPLFKRAIGEVTDVVEKEMYTFEDRNGDSLTLRPEGTAGCVRAGIEHGLLYNQEQRLWYIGPMFRHERPQKGRYRRESLPVCANCLRASLFAGIAYTVNQRLVRGLDYYNRTVFEWVTNSLGSQGTVCAGGRYDGLVEQLGGRATPAVGFAMGLERLVLLVQAVNPEFKADPVVDIYLVASGADTQSAAMALAERLRDELPGVKLMTNHGGGNFKKQGGRQL